MTKLSVGDAVYYHGRSWIVKEVPASNSEFVGIYTDGEFTYVSQRSLIKKEKP